MSKLFTNRVRILIVSVCSLFIIVLLSACQGVVTSNGASSGTATTGNPTVTGQIQAVNAQAHSVTLLVNGQQITVSGLTDQQIAALQSQINKVYSFQATQSSNNAYTINQNTQPQEENAPVSNQNGTPAQGSIEFAGKVLSANNNSLTINTPDGQSLSINIVVGQTDTNDMNGTPLSSGQIVKVKAITDQNGNFVASKLGLDDSDNQQKDLSRAQYKGITTSAVGTSNQLNFKVGNKTYSFPISSQADLGDFNSNAQSIGNNVQVSVKVIFNGTSGMVVSISNPNN